MIDQSISIPCGKSSMNTIAENQIGAQRKQCYHKLTGLVFFSMTSDYIVQLLLPIETITIQTRILDYLMRSNGSGTQTPGLSGMIHG